MTGTAVRAFDLFCGAGGSSLGAKQAGATLVGGVDMWRVATDAYRLNLPRARTYTADLVKLDPIAVAKEVGPINLLLASPECTNYSIAKGNRPRCERSRELPYQVIQFAEAMKPDWIVVENVIQMRSWERYLDWIERLTQLGYNSIALTLDSADFGVPQTRRRLYVICDRRGIPPTPRQYRKNDATVDKVLKTAPHGRWSFEFTPLQNGRRAPKTIERAVRAFESLGIDQEFLMVYYGSDAAGGYQKLDRPLRTITTLDRFALVRPNCVGHEMRMLQPSELSVAMGFPKTYRFPECAMRRDCIKLIGNAVCPPVMRAIVRALIKPQRVRAI